MRLPLPVSFLTKLSQPLRMMMVLLSLSSCAAQLQDGPLCSPIPTLPGQCRGSAGAACDSFLTKAPQDLNAYQWEALQETWEGAGCVVEETNSCFTTQLKAAIEKLCTVSTCTEAQQAQKRELLAGVNRLEKVPKRARDRARALGLIVPYEATESP